MGPAFVTGGAGFIGSALVRRLSRDRVVVSLDRMSRGSSREALAEADATGRHTLEVVDIVHRCAVAELFAKYRPSLVFHLAAETHVDRSIDEPASFISSNVDGTFSMLEAARAYWRGLDGAGQRAFRFLHVSTDEVFGSLGASGSFTETTAYAPRSPYAASKAASDHLVRAWHETYGLPSLISNCSNNFGPYQFPEKLIPLTIRNALAGASLPVYGNGENVRDWLYVDDHIAALVAIADRGAVGGTYNVGANNERTTLQVVHAICDYLEKKVPLTAGTSYRNLISFVRDRPGHDFRYAIDATKLRRELGWSPVSTFDAALAGTIDWYLDNSSWCADYDRSRLGLGVERG